MHQLHKVPCLRREWNHFAAVKIRPGRFTLATLLATWEREPVRGIIQRGNRWLAGGRGLLAWAAGIAVALGFSAKPSSTPIVVDEVYWIGSAYYFHLAAHARDFSNPDWRLLPARENPPGAKFLIGAALALAGESVNSPDTLGTFYLVFSGVPGAWGDSSDQAKREAVVSRMTPAGLAAVKDSQQVRLPELWIKAARAAMVVCLAAASLALFLLGRRFLGAMSALLVSISLPLHPIASEALNHALADAPALMFSAVAAALLAVCFQAISRTSGNTLRTSMLTVGAGAVSGFACATKMNSLVVIAVAAAGFAYLILHGARGAKSGGYRVAVISAAFFAGAALLTFLAVNPALYGDWWAGVRATVEEHRNTARIQAGFLPDNLSGITQRLGAVGTLVGFTRWAWLPPLACATLLLLKPRSGCHRFFAAWWLLAWVMVTAWIPFPWLRYAAPLLPPTLLLLAATADWLVNSSGTPLTRPAERP